MTNKKTEKIIISALTLVLIFIFIYTKIFHGPCLIKSVIHIPCPNCGASRALEQILQLNIIESFNYNILTFPLLIILLIIYILFIIDIFTKKEYLTKLINIFIKYYYIIILLIITSWIVNIVRGI